MMFRRWSGHLLIGIVLVIFGETMPLQAQMRGHSPNRVQQIDQIGQTLSKPTKNNPRLALDTFTNTEADYLDSTFWDAPPFLDGTFPVDWPRDWGVTDRRGDTRLKSSRILAKWNPQHDGTGSDHFYLRFDLQRVVTSAADFTSQGHLSDTTYAQMLDGGLLSGKTKIRIQLGVAYAKPDYVVKYVNWSEEVHLHNLTYDVMVLDVNGVPVNRLFPGRKYGGLAPTMDFTVQTSALRFPVKGATEPSPAWNVVHFKLIPPQVTSPDVYGGFGYFMHFPIPATFLPYSFLLDAELTFGAVAPIFLVHGTNADPSTWNEPDLLPPSPGIDNLNLPDLPAGATNFNQFFSKFLGICFNDITLRQNGAIDVNARILSQQVTDRLKSVGAKACHLIGHSKGGIDSRAMIINHYEVNHFNDHLDQPGHFEVLSLYTLDTPNRGTVLSDIAWNLLNKPYPVADPKSWDLGNLMAWDLPFLHWGGAPDGKGFKAPRGPALEAQMTFNMQEWNRKNTFDFSHKNAQEKPIRFYNTASDSDWHKRDATMDDYEMEYMGVPLQGVATSMYRMLYWAKEVKTRSGGTREVSQGSGDWSHTVTIPITELYVASNQDPGQWNDLVVTYSSAVYDGGTLFCPPSLQNFNNINLKNHSSVKNYGMARGIVAQIVLDWPVATQ